jgi:hypothetical protein
MLKVGVFRPFIVEAALCAVAIGLLLSQAARSNCCDVTDIYAGVASLLLVFAIAILAAWTFDEPGDRSLLVLGAFVVGALSYYVANQLPEYLVNRWTLVACAGSIGVTFWSARLASDNRTRVALVPACVTCVLGAVVVSHGGI